jgi:hypothetical protein
MKRLLALPLLALAACQASPNTQDAACAIPFEKTTLLVDNQVRHYILAPHFRPQRKECWAQLRGYLQSEDAPQGINSGAHLLVYIDTTDFALPAGGSLSGAARGRVIAQQLYDKAAGVNQFTADPNATGKYPQAR